MTVLKMADLDLTAKRVLIRLDLNVPIKRGVVGNDARIRASLPSIKQALGKGARVILMSHLGRPNEGEYTEEFSLAPVVAHLSTLLGIPVRLVENYFDQSLKPADGGVVLLENVRFNTGEKANDENLARRYAALCDVYVMDAFGAAHRAQASTYGVGYYAPQACAGPLLTAELEALDKVLDNPVRPLVAIVGGAKVSTKLAVLESLSKVVDKTDCRRGYCQYLYRRRRAQGREIATSAGLAQSGALPENSIAPTGR